MAESKLDVIMIIEILGKPPEYLKKSLLDLIDKLSKEPGVSLINKKIAEPKEVDKENGIFSSFAEIEVAVAGIPRLMALIFNYMPSHIEITNPEFMTMKNCDMNTFFNDLTRRLHQYDEIAKITIMQRNILGKQLQDAQKSLQENKEAKPKKEKKSSKKKAKK